MSILAIAWVCQGVHPHTLQLREGEGKCFQKVFAGGGGQKFLFEERGYVLFFFWEGGRCWGEQDSRNFEVKIKTA